MQRMKWTKHIKWVGNWCCGNACLWTSQLAQELLLNLVVEGNNTGSPSAGDQQLPLLTLFSRLWLVLHVCAGLECSHHAFLSCMFHCLLIHITAPELTRYANGNELYEQTGKCIPTGLLKNV